MNRYFYKGFQILQQNGAFLVLAPSLKYKVVHVSKTAIQAKLWIETIESVADLRKGARDVDAILAK